MKYLALLLLSGCAMFPPDYTWRKHGPPSTSYEWVVKPKAEVSHFCGLPIKWDAMACVVQIRSTGKCFIYSNVTEERSKHIYAGDNLNLWEHEMKHCEGWVHQPFTR